MVVALNAVDKIEPLCRSLPFQLFPEQVRNLVRKIRTVSSTLKIEEHQIVPVSAEEGYGIKDLVESMMRGVSPLISGSA